MIIIFEIFFPIIFFRTPHFACPHFETPHIETPHFVSPHFACPHFGTPHFPCPHTALRTPHSALRTPHSALRTPHSALRTPHSALRTPHSALRTPHSALRTPRFYDSPFRHLAAGVRNHLRAWVNSILQQLNSGNFDSGSQDSVFYRVESVYNTVARFDGVIAIDDNIVNYLMTLLPPHTRQKCYSLAIVVDRNMCVVAQERLEFLIEGHFSVPEIYKLLGVSTRTVERRMTEYGLNIRQSYGQINDSDLDGVLNGILKDFPNSGYKRMTGLLLARGIRL